MHAGEESAWDDGGGGIACRMAGAVLRHAWRCQALMLCAGGCEEIHAMAAHDDCIRSFKCMAAISRGLLLLLLIPSGGMHGLHA